MDPALLAQKKKMQIEIVLKDSDVRKVEREILQMEVEIRDIKHKQAQLQTDLIVKENAYKKLAAARMQMQNELIKLKHQMNFIGH